MYRQTSEQFLSSGCGAAESILQEDLIMHSKLFSIPFLIHFTVQSCVWILKRAFLKKRDICKVLLPVMVSSDAPDTDAADWLRVKQAAIIWINQG